MQLWPRWPRDSVLKVNAESSQTAAIDDCTASDSEAAFFLLKQLWPEKNLDQQKLARLFREVIEARSRVLLCAKLQDRMVGFGSMTLKAHFFHEGLIGWIDELVVDAPFRGRGIGSLLLNGLMAAARERGCVAAELDSAFHRNEAHVFYEKSGFEKRAFLFSKKLQSD
jgi:GNAT superfamily N-acetyltransferase